MYRMVICETSAYVHASTSVCGSRSVVVADGASATATIAARYFVLIHVSIGG